MAKTWNETQEHLALVGIVGCENVPMLINPHPTYLLFHQQLTWQNKGRIEIAKSGFLLVPQSTSLIFSEYLRLRWESLSGANQERLAKRHREIGEYLCNITIDFNDPSSELEVSNLAWF